MLISPKYKFIFFKPMKVAGSSIEKSLFDYCSNLALCAGSRIDSLNTQWEYPRQNNGAPDSGIKFHAHTWPELFNARIKDDGIFKNYKKITAIRNPWDQVVSFFWYSNFPEKPAMHDSKRKHKYLFEKWLDTPRTFNSYIEDDLHHEDITPDMYISGINEKFIDNSITDYIRFESINKDYDLLASELMHDHQEIKPLARLKTNKRKIKKHYSYYYNKNIIKRIEKYYPKTLEKFNYLFKKKD